MNNNGIVVKADEDLEISLQSSVTEATEGDVVTIAIVANKFAHYTRFENIVFDYNPDKTEFVSWQPSPVLTNFNLTANTDTEGEIVFGAIDEMSELTLSEDRESGLIDSDNYVDPSYYSDEFTILFSVSFRILSTDSEQVEFDISGVALFTDSSLNQYEVNCDEAYVVTTNRAISSDSTLASLSIEEYSITPEFASDVYEYAVSVGRDINEITILPVVSNTGASVVISGANNIPVGDSVATIDVTAEDGVTTTQYKIYITKQDDTVPLGSVITDVNGKIFTLMPLPTDVELPEGFVQTTRTIDGYSIPVYAREGVSSVLIMLDDGSNSPDMYFYNPLTHKVNQYNSAITVIRPSKILIVSSKTPSSIPDDFTPGSKIVAGYEMQGYYDKNGNFIAYLEDENNESAFYLYNEEIDVFTEYKVVVRTKEKIYHSIMNTFIIIALVEGVIIIAIVVMINDIIRRYKKPKPRRV